MMVVTTTTRRPTLTMLSTGHGHGCWVVGVSHVKVLLNDSVKGTKIPLVVRGGHKSAIKGFQFGVFLEVERMINDKYWLKINVKFKGG